MQRLYMHETINPSRQYLDGLIGSWYLLKDIQPDCNQQTTIDSRRLTNSIRYPEVCLCRNQNCVNHVDDTVISSNICCCNFCIIDFNAIRSINFYV